MHDIFNSMNTYNMNSICKRLVVYLPPAIGSSCWNRFNLWFPNSDDFLWMVYYWRKKNGRYRVRDHEKYIIVASHHTTFLQICHTLFKRSEKVRSWWRTWVLNHFRITPSWWWMWRWRGVITSPSLTWVLLLFNPPLTHFFTWCSLCALYETQPNFCFSVLLN